MDRNGLPRTRVKSKTCIPILKCAAGYDRLNPRVGFGLGIGIDFLEIRTGTGDGGDHVAGLADKEVVGEF